MEIKTYFMRSYGRNENQFTVEIGKEVKKKEEKLSWKKKIEKNMQHEPTKAEQQRMWVSVLFMEMTLKYVYACIAQWQSMIEV